MSWGFGVRPLSPVSTVGIAAVVVTKAADLLTTAVGLVLVEGITERNPLADALFARFGLLGLVGASVVGVAIVVAVVEWMATLVDANDAYALQPRTLYSISYVPLSVIYALVSIHNTILLIGVTG